MPKVFIGVGSNLGDRSSYFEFAEKELFLIVGLTDFRSSPVYETGPVDVEGGLFLNAVWSFETDLSPSDLLKKLQEVEAKAGRQRKKSHGARTLDLDILFYGDQVICETELSVPHPRLHERAFVLLPFCDLDGEWVHPALKRTMAEILKGLNSMKRGTGNAEKFVQRFPRTVSLKNHETYPRS